MSKESEDIKVLNPALAAFEKLIAEEIVKLTFLEIEAEEESDIEAMEEINLDNDTDSQKRIRLR